MHIRVLGKLEVERDGVMVDVGPYRQRALLALLVTRPGSVFSTDQLIDGLWCHDGAIDRQNSLWVYISGLRKALEPDRAKRTEGTVLLTRSPGYVVDAAAVEIDAVLFERLLAEGRSLGETDPAAASVVLGEALALWRGRPFEEFTYETFAQAEIARLEGLRLEAVEERIEADLRRGLARELISELETLVREHPLRERLTRHLMVALYRAGRQADSLRAYQALRARLGTELGIEPSTDLRRVEDQVVRGDETGDLTSPELLSGPGGPALGVRGYELREPLGGRDGAMWYRAYQSAVGREVAIKVIRADVANEPDFIRRFEAEAQVVARLEHPHIVPMYDFWREPDAAYLVTRWLPGGTLARALERGASATIDAARLAEQIGSALQAAHRSGVTHRAVTSASVLIDEHGNAYLWDFSIADASSQNRVASGVGSPPNMAISDDATDVHRDIAGLGEIVAQASAGLTGELEQIRGAVPPALLRVIDRSVGHPTAERHRDVASFVADLRSVLGRAVERGTSPIAELSNPYKGLRPFGAADAGDFYGRQRLVDRLLFRLGDPAARGRFVAVVGPSGSGKSSVVRAGLIPALRRGALPLSGDWFTVDMTPAPHPFEQLEDALGTVAVASPGPLLELLAGGERGLARAVERVLPSDGSQLLLFIDQFEELFTQVDDEAASRFLATLVDAVTGDHSRIRLVVTLRADFYDRPLRHRGFGELLRDGTEVITPMTAEELEAAIVGPVERLGVSYEPALLAELVRDVVDRPGALPLLQYALTELFDDRRGARITLASYRDLGGVSGALVERAEGLLAELGTSASEVVRQVFLRLVTLGEGADDTRRRALGSELEQLAVDRRVLDGVVAAFGRHRLLSYDRDPVTRSPTVEISHEALLTEWDRLRAWIDAARHDVRNQRRLAEAMREWSSAERSDDYLLRGGVLQQLEGWAATTSLPLSVPEQSFLDASTRERDRTQAEQRDRELRAAAAEQRARRRIRQLTAMGVVAAIGAALAGFGIWQWRQARSASTELEALVRSADLVERSESVLGADPDVALVLAIEALRSTVGLGYVTEDAVDAVHWALQENRTPYVADDTASVGVRNGPAGRRGVFYSSPAELAAFADSTLDPLFSDRTCREQVGTPCSATEIPAGLEPQFGVDAYTGRASGSAGELNGTVVTFAAGPETTPRFDHDVQQFEYRTGIDVRVEPSPVEPGSAITARELANRATAGRSMPDVARIVDLGNLVEFNDRIAPVDLGSYIDTDVLEQRFGRYLLGLGTIDGSVGAVPIQLAADGLIFFRRDAFEQAGYSVPTTWDELMSLTRRMVDDGETPWCLAFDAEPYQLGDLMDFDGWPGSDLLNDLVLRSAGVEPYDSWSRHEIPFDTPPVLAAGRLLEQLLFEDGFVADTDDVASLDADEAFARLNRNRPGTSEHDPGCWLYPQNSIRLEHARSFEIGPELDFFELPMIDQNLRSVSNGDAAFAVQLSDRPEVRRFMEFLVSSEWGVEQALEGPFISPHSGFPMSIYGRELDRSASDVARRVAAGVRAALEADRWRVDASQLRPSEIGSYDGFARGELFSGMIDLAHGRRTIEEVLADTEAVWTELEAAEAQDP